MKTLGPLWVCQVLAGCVLCIASAATHNYLLLAINAGLLLVGIYGLSMTKGPRP